jgi:hypothetical protein
MAEEEGRAQTAKSDEKPAEDAAVPAASVPPAVALPPNDTAMSEQPAVPPRAPEVVATLAAERPAGARDESTDGTSPLEPPAPATTPPSGTTGTAAPAPGRLPMLKRMRRAYPRLADLLWPDLDPKTDDEIAAQARKDNERHKRNLAALRPASTATEAEAELDEAARKALLEAVDALVADEKDRRQSVETRLTTVLGFVTVASTLAMGAIGLRVHDGLLGTCVPLGILAVLLMSFMVVQVIRAGFAAISGLERGNVDAPPVHVTIAATHDPSLSVSIAEHRMKYLESLSELTNRKVNELAIAHEALRNFLRGALALICVIVTMLIGDLTIGPSDGASDASAVPPTGTPAPHDVGVLMAPRAAPDAAASPRSPAEDAGTIDTDASVDVAPATMPGP